MDLDKHLSNYKNRTDYDNFEPETSEVLNQLFDKYSQQASSTHVRRGLEKMHLNASFQAQVYTRKRKTEAIVELGEQEHGILRDSAMKMWLDADPAYRPVIAKSYEMKVREFADKQIFSLGKAEQFIRSFNSTAQELDFENKLYNDPKQALIDADNPEMYQDVEATKRAKFSKRAKQAVS